jgi:iron complex outermembrane receptor protein
VYGAVLKYEKSFSKELNAKLGYWAHRQQPPGPPTNQKKYSVTADGLKFAGYAVLADNGYHDFNSPFTELSGQLGDFVYSAGIRYLNFKLGELKSYTNGTNASTSQDYNTAISNGTLDSWASVDAKYFREWLPSAYLGYIVNKDATLYVDYTRTYGLDVNLFPTYVQQRANFVPKGVALQDLWDDLELETADNFDLGVKYKIGDIYLNPNVFVSVVHNKQARIYDASYNVTYPYNGADALGYGVELPVSGAITKDLDFLLSLSYNRYYFTEDLRTASNTTISSEGNQVPDAPEYMAKAALTYKIFDFALTPSVRFLSKRYGDVLNKEEIDDNTIVDFDISYVIGNVPYAKAVEFRITATNLFNTKYISAINTADDALAATTNAATYQTGAPFGIYGNIKFLF